jgi:LAO/AO transport system kinase
MEITESVKNKLMKDVFAKMGNEEFDQKIQKVMAKEIDPYTVAEALYRQILERRE